MPIELPPKVKVAVADGVVRAEGPMGKLSLTLHPDVGVAVEGNMLTVSRKSDENQAMAMHGTTRAHLANMIKGVSKGFERLLDISGVGYNATLQGKTLKLVLGFSHPVELQVPDGVTCECPNPTNIVVKGMEIQRVHQFAAEIRGARPVEPYNLKGVKYRDEVVRKKAGKSFVTGAS